MLDPWLHAQLIALEKAKVENGVQQVERWILAPLRHQRFFSLGELNEQIRRRLEELNNRPMKILEVSRRELFLSLDGPALGPLPESRYEFARWKKVRVGCDYHVEFDRHYYSVPYQLLRQELDLRATAHTVEVLHKNKRVAAHARSRLKGHHTTVKEHMPQAHKAHVEWTPVRLAKWAQKTGEATAQLVEKILRSRLHPQQGFRSCLGLLRLGEKYGQQRLEAACDRALRLESLSYRSVKSILKNGLDQQPFLDESFAPERAPVNHSNLRGAQYYATIEEKEATSC